MGTPVAVAPRELRPYQADAVAAVEADWLAGTDRTGVVLPTGAGKSTVIGKLASNAYRRGERVVLLAHRGELLEQMLRDLRAVDPMIPETDLGIVRAEQDDHHAPIVAATLQTLATAHRREALGHRDVILWDEVHHAGAAGYHATFEELGGYSHAKMCGLTATMHRDERSKGKGLGDVIQKIAYKKDLKWAIKQGYLVKPRGLTVRVENLNALNDVRTVAGDFHQAQLAEVMEAATEYVVDAIEMHAGDRTSIVFAASVDAAHVIADALSDRGLAAEAVTGEMEFFARQGVYQRFRDGRLRALVTVMVLTEGADFPMCDTVVLARPTRSRNLYSQMVGRALRLFEGKTDALVLDLAGSTRVMKLVTLVELVKDADVKVVNTDGDEIVAEELPPIEDYEPPIKLVRQGPVDMVTIDLLDGDDTLWLETPGGVPFISLRDGWLVFLWPETEERPVGEGSVVTSRYHEAQGLALGRTETVRTGRYAVGNMNTRNRQGGWLGDAADGEEVYYELAEAIERAEESAVEAGFQLPGKAASWRTGNRPPSEAQLRLARGLHIPEYEDMTKGRLSDEISITYAARVLDR